MKMVGKGAAVSLCQCLCETHAIRGRRDHVMGSASVSHVRLHAVKEERENQRKTSDWLRVH